MEHIRKFIELGESMGLAGKELADFVDKRESAMRDNEREIQRIEREERAKEREERMKDKEFKELEKQALLKIELAGKVIELAKINASKPDFKSKSPDVKAKVPRLPSFIEGKDDMDSFLKRFERFAVNAKWPKEEWATNLSALLQGKALDVYSRLSSADAQDYDKLCENLLKRYQLTEEGFRQKFRTSKQEIGETAGQFMVRLSSYLCRWMELGNVDQNYASLRDLILREQFLNVSNKSLVLFLKERKIKTIEDMTELADQYNEAHSVTDQVPRQSPINRIESIRKDDSKVNSVEENKQKLFRERFCYGCGQNNHFIKSCPLKNNASPNLRTSAACINAGDIVPYSGSDEKHEKGPQ